MLSNGGEGGGNQLDEKEETLMAIVQKKYQPQHNKRLQRMHSHKLTQANI